VPDHTTAFVEVESSTPSFEQRSLGIRGDLGVTGDLSAGVITSPIEMSRLLVE